MLGAKLVALSTSTTFPSLKENGVVAGVTCVCLCFNLRNAVRFMGLAPTCQMTRPRPRAGTTANSSQAAYSTTPGPHQGGRVIDPHTTPCHSTRVGKTAPQRGGELGAQMAASGRGKPQKTDKATDTGTGFPTPEGVVRNTCWCNRTRSRGPGYDQTPSEPAPRFCHRRSLERQGEGGG